MCWSVTISVKEEKYYRDKDQLLSQEREFSSVQLLSQVQLCVTPWTAAHQASLSYHQLPEITQTHVHWVWMPCNHLILSRPLLLLLSIFPSIRVFSDESALHIRWPEYWSFSFNISPSNEHPGLMSFMMTIVDSILKRRDISLLTKVI